MTMFEQGVEAGKAADYATLQYIGCIYTNEDQEYKDFVAGWETSYDDIEELL